jgi:phospholipase C
MTLRPSRRDVLKAGAVATAGMASSSVLPPALLRALAAPPPRCGVLPDIEHVIFFIQENRSFDHYFGRYPGVRGFSDRSVRLFSGDDGSSVFKQANTGNTPNPVLPFHLNTTQAGTTGECTHDVGHQWVEQHQCWHNGKMDAFVTTHASTTDGEGPQAGPLTMGYYQREDLPFYWELADNFTICDNYFTSAISGTVANRIYGLCGTIDPDGAGGGPVINTPESGNQQDYLNLIGALTFKTYPEVLQDNGISWKVYNPNPVEQTVQLLNNNYLIFFKNFTTNPALAERAFGAQAFPADFLVDLNAGTLPQVSWICAPFVETEHPPTPITWGEFAVGQVLQALASKPNTWAKTALILTWDDSGGFFDHVPPPVPANPNEPGEHLSASATPPAGTNGGILSPIGLGFRVPTLVISPFSRNPLPRTDPNWRPMVCSDLLDHTSHLRFLKSLLVSQGKAAADVELPSDTAWRRSQAGGTGVGDLTGAFNFAGGLSTAPSLTYPSAADFLGVLTKPECALAPGTEIPAPQPDAYPIPSVAQVPAQDPGRPRRPSGPINQAACFPVVTTPGGAQVPGTLPNTAAAPGAGAVATVAGLGLAAGAWWTARRLTVARSESSDS